MPIINQEPPPYLFKPLHETSPSSTSKRKRNKLKQSSSPPPSLPHPSSSSSSSASTSTVDKSDENNSSIKTFSTRSKKKTRINEQTLSIKQEGGEDEEDNLKDESLINTEIKTEEQENEKPLIGTIYYFFRFFFNRIDLMSLSISDKVFSVRKSSYK
jgi:hypothetical protein